MHAYLIDQPEPECLLQDGRSVQTDDLVACHVLGLLDGADDAVGDERVHGWMRRGRFVVGDHEPRGIADGATVALIFVKSLATHHDGADAIQHLVQDGPVLVGRRVEHPVVQHPCTVAERGVRVSIVNPRAASSAVHRPYGAATGSVSRSRNHAG